MSDPTVGCALDCGDGRSQGPSRKWQKATFGVGFVDKITVAGLVKQLVEKDPLTMAFVRRELFTYLTKHKVKVVTISAHDDCAGNRTRKKRQLKQLRMARKIIIDMIKSFNLEWDVEVFLLWINKQTNGHWMPAVIGTKPRVGGYYAKV